MPDIAGKIDKTFEKGLGRAVETVPEDNSSDRGVADRLRKALIGKKRSEIIAASGVSDGTISRALRGATTRRGTLASLADALGLSPDWLIYGTGEMRRLQPGDVTAEGYAVVQGSAMPIARQEAPVLNVDRLASALEATDQMFRAENRSPTPRQRVQAMLLIYNHLTEVQSQIDVEDQTPLSQEKSELSR